MMARIFYSIAFIAILLTPPVTQWIIRIPRHSLRGVTASRETPDLSVDAFLKQTLQRSAEQTFKERMQLWPYLVRTENQINVSLFQQIGTSYSTQMILGKDNVLMHRTYLRHANRLKKVREKQVVKTLDSLIKLREALSRRGISLILLISPNKPTLYPEYLPQAFRASKQHRQVETLYERLKPQLQNSGIPIIDAYTFLQSLKETEEIPVFPASGSHWSDYAACLISARLAQTMQQILNKPIPQFSCEKRGIREIPLDFDRDHASVANVWNPAPFLQPTVAVNHSSPPTTEELYRPRVTIIGTSFVWSILRYLDRHRVYSERDFYFYFKTNYRFPGNGRKTIKPKALDWKGHLFLRDFIILEVNEAWLDKVGYGFIRQALKHL